MHKNRTLLSQAPKQWSGNNLAVDSGMKRSWALAALLMVPLLSMASCSSDQTEQKVSSSVDSPDGITIEAESISEGISREAVFIYGNKADPRKNITLKVGGEPILLPSGYLRLSGVVRGCQPIACLESGGRGLVLGKGEKMDDYRVVRIDGDHVILEK